MNLSPADVAFFQRLHKSLHDMDPDAAPWSVIESADRMAFLCVRFDGDGKIKETAPERFRKKYPYNPDGRSDPGLNDAWAYCRGRARGRGTHEDGMAEVVRSRPPL